MGREGFRKLRYLLMVLWYCVRKQPLKPPAELEEQLRGEYRENKPLFTCPTRQHLLAPRPCPHGGCPPPPPRCQCWLLVRPLGWPPASRAAHHAGSKLRP